ncbi:hypothetical protein O181_028718 [Austropuccinia psidii MF-1]|uniref:Uncharacterized protein n=1 Tax=Austropuccinia psidii MF-1 TaxID=1389203 RepID=A0A9Q3CS52_9BASI|nr:hypothetical protein [Austropuccinia psidii MF-1]
MGFLHHNSHAQPTGSSSRQANAQQIQNVISQSGKSFARFFQQEEINDQAEENPWGSKNHNTDKGKGRHVSFEDQVPNYPKASSSRAQTTQTRRSQHPQARPSSSVRCNPIQMLMQDAPPDFKYTKEALYVHIKRLWGMLTPGTIPTAPDNQLLKEFYQRFSSAEEVQSVAHNSQGVKLINKAQVQTLRNAQAGKRKIGKNIINMQDFYITYVHAMLAKMGICIWAPYLEEDPDSLYNEACWIVALMTF